MDSVVPASITSKGLATHGSVYEHTFGKSDPYTLGVEEEYMLLDQATFDLVQHIDTVLAAVEGSELEEVIRPELMQSVLEISTPVCRNIADVDHQLRKLRSAVTQIAREEGQYGPHLALFEAVGRVAPVVLGRSLPLNGAGACGAALADIGIPLALLRGVVLLARCAGLLGQLAEEMRNPIANDIFRTVESHAVYVEPQS